MPKMIIKYNDGAVCWGYLTKDYDKNGNLQYFDFAEKRQDGLSRFLVESTKSAYVVAMGGQMVGGTPVRWETLRLLKHRLKIRGVQCRERKSPVWYDPDV